MRFITIFTWLVLCGSISLAQPHRYTELNIEGWRVYVEPGIQHERSYARAIELLRVSLSNIAAVVDSTPLAMLREVPIWIELKTASDAGYEYHFSEQWLVEHDELPQKARALEIGIVLFAEHWRDDLWCVLGALAMNYLDRLSPMRFLKFQRLHVSAHSSSRFKGVLLLDGSRERIVDVARGHSYFADATKAFFGVNRYYPFVRAELAEVDPPLFHFLVEVWGNPR